MKIETAGQFVNCIKCGKPVFANFDNPTCIACLRGEPPEKKRKPAAWVKFVKLLRKPEDTGVGDTVQRIAAKFGGERFKRFASRIGMPCGCTTRQREWNNAWPY